MKKIVNKKNAVLLTCLVVALAGCGEAGKTDATPTPVPTNTAAPTTTTAPTEAAESTATTARQKRQLRSLLQHLHQHRNQPPHVLRFLQKHQPFL